MTINIDKTVKWFDDRKGKLTYSMYGSRNGSDDTADCSGAITQAIREAGGIDDGVLYSTVTLGGYLSRNGYECISKNEDWDAKRGDIVLMSWSKDMSTSAGSGGHVVVMKDAERSISVDFTTGGQTGTAVSEHNWNDYYFSTLPEYIEVWRLHVSRETNTTNSMEVIKMECIIQKNKSQYYFDGTVIKLLANPDEANTINGVYKAINKKNITVVIMTDTEFNKLLALTKRNAM